MPASEEEAEIYRLRGIIRDMRELIDWYEDDTSRSESEDADVPEELAKLEQKLFMSSR